jgi:hypothetical protein
MFLRHKLTTQLSMWRAKKRVPRENHCRITTATGIPPLARLTELDHYLPSTRKVSDLVIVFNYSDGDGISVTSQMRYVCLSHLPTYNVITMFRNTTLSGKD